MGFKRILSLDRIQQRFRCLSANSVTYPTGNTMDKIVNLSSKRVLINENNENYDQVNSRQFSDFSINTILSGRKSVEVIDNRREIVYKRSSTKPKSQDIENGVDLTRNNHPNSTVSITASSSSSAMCSSESRPLNKVFESPWSSKNPVIFTQKLNPLSYDINSTVISVQSANYCFNYNSFNHHLNPINSPSSDISRTVKSIPNSPNLGYYFFPPPVNNNNNNTNCPCKQCEIRNFNAVQTTSPGFLDNEAILKNGSFYENPLLNLKSRYECDECGKGFSQLRNYKYHLSIHKGTKEFAAHCPECGKMFNDKGYLSSHLKIHRNRKEYVCPHCPKSFNQRVAFNMHVRIHTGVKPHKCTECGKRFSRKMLLKQHLRTHSGEKPYVCGVCGKTFADRSNMTLHQRLHSGKLKNCSCVFGVL